jgi:hypothetical protein
MLHSLDYKKSTYIYKKSDILVNIVLLLNMLQLLMLLVGTLSICKQTDSLNRIFRNHFSIFKCLNV